MGGKITIDSATLMNKGLEVIEAHHLFGTPYDRIDVVVHPQSIIHALVTLCDGAALAHMGHPDMRVPISYALHHPERVDVPAMRPLDLAELGSLTFERPDVEAFPCLRLARAAAEAGGTGPCVLNAANEVAVHAFLGGRLGFMGIPAVIEETLDRVGAGAVHSFDSLYEADARARDVAEGLGRRLEPHVRVPELQIERRIELERAGTTFSPLAWSGAARCAISTKHPSVSRTAAASEPATRKFA